MASGTRHPDLLGWVLGRKTRGKNFRKRPMLRVGLGGSGPCFWLTQGVGLYEMASFPVYVTGNELQNFATHPESLATYVEVRVKVL
jgi:hypothetical protein